MAGVDRNWQAGPDFNTAVKEFHYSYARAPDMRDAKQLLELYKGDLRRVLATHGVCSRLEYAGSAYEGTKVSRSDTDKDLEFDIMIFLRCQADVLPGSYQLAIYTEGMINNLTHHLDGTNVTMEGRSCPPVAFLKVEPTSKQGYVRFVLNRDKAQTNQFIIEVSENNVLLPEKLANQFRNVLQLCLRQCQQDARALFYRSEKSTWELEQLCYIDDRIKLLDHGPAVQMDVMHWPNTSEKFFSVDMVPTIEIPRGNDESDYYVAKLIKGQSGLQDAWRQSFSLEEKKLLVRADKENGCRKQVFRVLKVLRNGEARLEQLTSYHLKTALFRTMQQQSEWRIDCLGRRLMDVIGQLEKDLENRYMSHYYLPGVNLLEDIGDDTVKDMHNILEGVIKSGREMMKLLRVSEPGAINRHASS